MGKAPFIIKREIYTLSNRKIRQIFPEKEIVRHLTIVAEMCQGKKGASGRPSGRPFFALTHFCHNCKVPYDFLFWENLSNFAIT